MKFFEEQLAESISIILPSSLLESVGGYHKVKNIGESITKLLFSSAISNHVLLQPEEKIKSKVE